MSGLLKGDLRNAALVRVQCQKILFSESFRWRRRQDGNGQEEGGVCLGGFFSGEHILNLYFFTSMIEN